MTVSPQTRLRQVRLEDLSETERSRLCGRTAVPDPEVRKIAQAICEEVRVEGDRAMERLAERYGGGYLRVPQAELEAAARDIPDVVAALEDARERIAAFHRFQIPSDLHTEITPGVAVTRRWSPLQRVGAYVPGGKAAYPSTALMTVIPAKVAGVSEVAVATPAGPDGSVNRATLAACLVAGADEVWAMGGAGAIAAFAYGTRQVKRVQKVVGPGSQWVTAAKLAVFGDCGIDLPAGPSEVLVLADHSADPLLVAADLLCQAEHGPDSPAVLVTTDPDLPLRVEAALEEQLATLERRDILAEALADHGMTVIVADMSQALSFTNQYAAEHVSLLTSDSDNPCQGGHRRWFRLRGTLVGGVGGRLRNRRQPCAAHRRPGRLLRSALGGGLRLLATGTTSYQGGFGRDSSHHHPSGRCGRLHRPSAGRRAAV